VNLWTAGLSALRSRYIMQKSDATACAQKKYIMKKEIIAHTF
jgi:hypothetical protein